MNGLKLSKVSRAAVPMVARRPPFGASGLTQSKCWKSAGYLRSPKAERPWRGPSAAATAAPEARPSRIAATAGFQVRVGRRIFDAPRPVASAAAQLARLVGRALGLRLVPPPDAQERRIARGQLARAGVVVPHREPLERRVPLRHDVVVPQQHAVERPGGGNQLGAVLGKDDPVDQLVDGRVLDADDVGAGLLVGGRRAPEVALLVARGFRLMEGAHDDVKIELAETTLELCAVNGAQADVDAELLQLRHIGEDDALEVRLPVEELGLELYAGGV